MSYARNMPYDVSVAAGLVAGTSTVNIYGTQTAVSTSSIPIWEFATGYTYPVAATQMNLVSNTAGDTTQTVLIQGLDANYTSISEVLALNGTTPITTVNSYLRINSIREYSGSATGQVTLKSLDNATTYAAMNAAIGQSQMSLYTVPAGYTFYLSRVDVYTSLNGSSSDFVTYRNLSTNNVTGVRTVTQQAPFTNTYHAQRVMPRPFSQKTDIQLQCKAATGPAVVSIAAEGYLIQNQS